jgi:hypothetical protein
MNTYHVDQFYLLDFGLILPLLLTKMHQYEHEILVPN